MNIYKPISTYLVARAAPSHGTQSVAPDCTVFGAPPVPSGNSIHVCALRVVHL